jgi:hypothetical protein
MTYRYGIAGDWHGNTAWAAARLDDLRDAGITEVLHLGDFGLFGDPDGIDYLTVVNSTAASNGQKVLVTLGNHDNYVMVGAFVLITEGEYAGWEYNPNFKNILYATRGQRWEREGVSFVSLGGANSIDRYGRIEGVNWWSGEQIGYGDIYRTIEGGHADVFLAHDCPEGVELFGTHRDDDGTWSENALEYARHSRVATRQAVDEVKPTLYFHGHYHHYINKVTHLHDVEGVGYDLHTIGLDKDDCSNNIGILELPSLDFSILV